MTIEWSPEPLLTYLPYWWDGSDVNSNYVVSKPVIGKGQLSWRNKGTITAFLRAEDSEGNVSSTFNYRPKFMGKQITKLSIVANGNQYYAPLNSQFEIKLLSSENLAGGDSDKAAERSIVYISGTTQNGGFVSIRNVGGSYGYEVGDLLYDASGGAGQGVNAATFRVDEVADLGGVYFNETDNEDNFLVQDGALPNDYIFSIQESTVFIACCLNDDGDDTDAFFKIIDEADQGRDITLIYGSSGVGQETQYNVGLKYTNSSGNAVVDPAAYPTDARAEGDNSIYQFTMSETVAGQFRVNGVKQCDLEVMKMPNTFRFCFMSDGFSASEIQSTSSRGALYEVLVFNRRLDEKEIEKAEGYLNAKYRLNCLDTSQPFSNEPPDIDVDPPTSPPPPEQPDPPEDPSDPITPPVLPPPPAPDPDPQPVPPAAPPTISEITGSYLFGGAHRLSPRNPVQLVEMFLDFCDNQYGVDDTVSTCQASGGSGFECYNTKETCQDPTNYNRSSNGTLGYRFTSEVGNTLPNIKALPAIISVTSAPVEIQPTKGVSVRANVTIKLRDFYDTGAEVDPYFETRNVIALENGSYFQKLMRRNPHYINRTIRISDGYIDQAGREQFYGGVRSYIISSMSLDKDVLTIKCKDPLSLAEELKSLVPTPSNFSLGASITGGQTPNHVALKYDGITIDHTNSLDVAKVTNYFGANDEVGFVRINDEILKYQVHIDSNYAAIDITDRDEWGTKHGDENHDVNDIVQKCTFFGTYDGTGSSVTINDVAYQLLVNEAGIPASAINNLSGGKYSWADERTSWLSSLRVDAILSEPKEVNKQLSQLGSMVGVNFFYEDKSSKVVMRAETPELDVNTILTITDEEIVEDSVKIINSEKERVSRVYYYYNIRNHTSDRDKPKSYKNLYIAIDSDSETPDEYGKGANKIIYSWGIKDTSTATSVSQRVLGRFKKTPKTITFKLDASRAILSTGDHFYIRTKHLLDPNGDIERLEMQCLSNKFDSKKQCYEIKAKQFRFGTVNFAEVTTNTVGGFDKDAADNTSAGYNSVNDATGGTGTSLDPYVGLRSTNAFICDHNHVTLSIIDGGSGFTNGETLEFKPDESSTGAASNTRNLTATYTQSSGKITSITVTSNAESGELVGDSHNGYAANEILTASPNAAGGNVLRVRLTKLPRMSGGQEPYIII